MIDAPTLRWQGDPAFHNFLYQPVPTVEYEPAIPESIGYGYERQAFAENSDRDRFADSAQGKPSINFI